MVMKLVTASIWRISQWLQQCRNYLNLLTFYKSRVTHFWATVYSDLCEFFPELLTAVCHSDAFLVDDAYLTQL